MVVVPVQIGNQFAAGKPEVLFENGSLIGSGADTRFAVTNDGQRFLMVQANESGPDPTRVHVVLNWLEELRTRLQM